MADDKTTTMPEQPGTETGPGKETPPETEKTAVPPEADKKPKHEAPDLEDDYCEYEDEGPEEITEEPEDDDTPPWDDDTEGQEECK